MAKGNPYWGKQRGKLGETVLSVVNGQQIQRVYNSQPRNPRSTAQTEQRAIFATAVKFYKHATQQYFKFAFESKKQNESDFNAFMRLNAKNGMIVSREQYTENNYPAIGHFMLSQGSLPSVEWNTSDPDIPEVSFGTTLSAAPTTLGQVADALASTYGLQQGDIITIIRVSSSLQDIEDMPSAAPRWYILQTIVGNNDARTLESIKSQIDMTDTDDERLSITLPSDHAGACAITFSRNTSTGVKVSDTQLVNNDVANTIFADSLRTAFREAALNSWKRSGDALLKGALANATEKTQHSAIITTTTQVTSDTTLASYVTPRILNSEVVVVKFTGGELNNKTFTIGDGVESALVDNVQVYIDGKKDDAGTKIKARSLNFGVNYTFTSVAITIDGLPLVQA